MSLIEHMQLDLIDEDENVAIMNQISTQEVNETSLDLDTYINNYKDFTKYLRLIFIARRCHPLRLDALIMALNWLKTTWNFVEYCKVFNIISITIREDRENSDAAIALLNPGVCCREDFNFQRFQTRISYDPIRLPNGQILEFDSEWVDRTRRLSNQTLDGLDTDLKNYKANNMAESIRRGCDDLACVNMNTGDLLSANKNYTRSRDYCKTDAHELQMAINVIRVSVYLGQWRHVQSYVERAEVLLENLSSASTSHSIAASQQVQTADKTPSQAAGAAPVSSTSVVGKPAVVQFIGERGLTSDQKENRLRMKTFLHCVVGLLEMHERNYAAAARSFLQADNDHMSDQSSANQNQHPQSPAQSHHQSTISHCSNVISSNDVALYGTICSLATFDRTALKNSVIQNTNFKLFLENEPILRDILMSFYNFQYAKCLESMEMLKSQLLLDVYLAEHVEFLYREIRNKALCQYFSPYNRAHLVRIASCFNTSVPQLVHELRPLIASGQLRAKIDSKSGFLVATTVDQQHQVLRRSLELCDAYEKRVKAALVHNACIRSDIYQNTASGMGGLAQNFGDVQMDI